VPAQQQQQQQQQQQSMSPQGNRHARATAAATHAAQQQAVRMSGLFRQVIATYDFVPTDGASGQLSFRKGDLILVTDESEASHGWLEGVLADRQGWFPANRVERIRQKPLLVALYDMDATKPGYLSFRAGDVLTLRQAFPAWYEGELDGKVGLVPNNYVKPLTQALEDPSAPSMLLAAAHANSSGPTSPTAAAAAAAAAAVVASSVVPGLPEFERSLSPTPRSPTLRSRGKRRGIVSPRSGRIYHSSHVPPTPFLKFSVMRGRRLPTVSGTQGTAPDVFVDVSVGELSVCSDVVRHSTAPEWRVVFFLPIGGLPLLTTHLRVLVSHARADHGDDVIGALSIPLTYFRERRTRSGWYPLQPRASRGEVRLKLLYEVDGGALQVEIVEGRGLIDSSGPHAFASPYVVCELGEFREQSAALESAVAPRWCQKMRIPSARTRDDLVVSVFDDSDTRTVTDASVRPGFMGDLQLPLALLVPGQLVDEWFTLTARELNTANGDIFLSADWTE
jgi:hypothetical protein